MGRSQLKYRPTRGRGHAESARGGRGTERSGRGGGGRGRGGGGGRDLESNAFRYNERDDVNGESDAVPDQNEDTMRNQFFAEDRRYRDMPDAKESYFRTTAMKQWDVDDEEGEETTGSMDYLNRTLLRPSAVGTAPADPATMAGDTAAILANVLKTGEISDPERAYLVSAVVTSTGATPAEAATRVDAAINATQTARSDAEKGLVDPKAAADKLAADADAIAIRAAELARVSAILSAFLLAS